MKVSKLSKTLYFLAVLVVLVPVIMALSTGRVFDGSTSKMLLSVGLSLVIISRTVYEVELYRKEKAIEVTNIGAIVGLILFLFWNIIR